MAIAISAATHSVGEIQRQYLYGVKFTHLPVSDEFLKVYSGKIFGDKDLDTGMFDCYCVKAGFPDRKQDTIELRYGGERYFYAGVDMSTKMQDFEFLVSENSEIFSFINALKDLTGDLFNNRAQPKSVIADGGAGYADTELAIAVSMVSVDKCHGSRNMFRELRNCSVYTVEGIQADKTAVQKSPMLLRAQIGFDYIGTAAIDASGAVWGRGHNYTVDWAVPGSVPQMVEGSAAAA